MDAALHYIRRFREATGRHLTVTHLMARIVGRVLTELPEINAISRWRGIYLRKEISVFFQVAIEDPRTGNVDLSGIKIREPQRKTLVEIVGRPLVFASARITSSSAAGACSLAFPLSS